MMEKQSMRLRLTKLAIFLSFLVCYLEWGGGNSGFVFQLEFSLFSQENAEHSFTHPFVLIPFLGQLMLLISIFLPKPYRRLTITAVIMLSVLVLVISLVGILSVNIKIIASTIPFLTLAVYYIFTSRKVKQAEV